MNIAKLLTGIVPTDINLTIKGLSLNSNSVKKGYLFIAVAGTTKHGVEYITEAISNGCVAVLVDSMDFTCSVPSIRIDNLKKYLSILATTFYKNAINVELIGVTGTNGKTSTSCFICQLLNELGVKIGFIGTLGITDSDCLSINTTPDIFTLYEVLDSYYSKDIKIAVIEVSSHGLAQNRVAGLNFKQVIFTNISEEHLDYHKTLVNYCRAKARLFAFNSVETAIINKDDENKQYFVKAANGKKQIEYGVADFIKISPHKHGFLCQFDNFIFELALFGSFNLVNVLAALNSVEQLGFERRKIIPLLTKLTPPMGRIHKIKNRLVWVDYAHTADALEQAIIALKNHYPFFKVKLVFGCGGERYKGKRKKMGEVADKFADSIILTNDNFRNENPQDIINHIKSGIANRDKLEVIFDRRSAIETAIALLQADECLLIAGKGHESEQQCNNKSIKLSDIEIATNA